MRFLTFLGVGLVATSPALAQQDTSSADLLAKLEATGMKLHQRNPFLDDITSTRLREITYLSRFLAELNNNSPMPGYYTQTLRTQSSLLTEIAGSDHLSESHKTAIWQIAKDLAVKKSFAQKNHDSPYEISVDFSRTGYLEKLYIVPLGRLGPDSPYRLIYNIKQGRKFKVPPGIFSIHTGEYKARYLTLGLNSDAEFIIPSSTTLPELDNVASSHKTLEGLRSDANKVFDIAKRLRATELTLALEKNMNRSTFLHDLAVTKQMPKAYFETLASEANVYDRIIGQGKIGTMETKLLFSISLDLEAKEAYARKNPNEPFKSVIVAATTKDSSNSEVKGYEVWYVGAGNCDNTRRYLRYHANSSPTSQPLSPGYWLMWTQSPENPQSRGAVKPVYIGLDGENRLSVDLPIPDATTPFKDWDCCNYALH